MRVSLSIILCLGLTILANAQTKTYSGPVFGVWGDPSNWSPPGVPTTEDVLIPSGSMVTVDVSATMDTLSVEPNASITLVSGNTMDMSKGFFRRTHCSILKKGYWKAIMA